jgi:chromosome segregation ATPase
VFVVGVSGIAISGESSLSISKPQSSVSGQRVDSKAASDKVDRGLESARKAVLKADQYPGVKRDIKSMEKEQAELEKRKSVLEVVVKKLRVARNRAKYKEKANPSNPEVYKKKMDNYADQINERKEELADIEARMPMLEKKLVEARDEKEILDIERGIGGGILFTNDDLDEEYDTEVRERFEEGRTLINLRRLVTFQ